MFNSERIANVEERVANIENGLLPVFVEYGTGLVISQKFGVKIPIVREVSTGPYFGAGGGGGGYFPGHRGGMGGMSMSVSVEVREFAFFHKDRAPQCDYAKLMLDGSVKFYNKVATPAPIEVDITGKPISSGKTSKKASKKK